ncbi:MAG: histidinol-phosphate transaminase [Deltaproteobacteria bacterium]|nr:histidinol-phosphate transaminase [Deltaproteobacteria bacterium]
MSYFRQSIENLKGYAPGFQPSDQTVVKLNTNENPYPPSPKVIEAIQRMSPDQMRRYPPAMGDAFREAAAELNGVTPGSILCCNGGDDLLTIAFRALCDENRAAAYPTPTYSLYSVLARLQNCPVKELPFDETFNLPNTLAGTGAALTIVCNPNAPSGSIIEAPEMRALAEKLKNRSILLIDEAYADFSKTKCTRLVDELDNVIILRSMSKGYSLAGLRFGYAIARPEIISELAKVKDSYNVNTVSIVAATAAIRDQDYFLSNVIKIKAERGRVTVALRKLGFDVPDSETNFVLAKCPSGNASALYEKLVKHNIFVRYFDLPRLTDKLRITIGTRQQNDALLAALGGAEAD